MYEIQKLINDGQVSHVKKLLEDPALKNFSFILIKPKLKPASLKKLEEKGAILSCSMLIDRIKVIIDSAYNINNHSALINLYEQLRYITNQWKNKSPLNDEVVLEMSAIVLNKLMEENQNRNVEVIGYVQELRRKYIDQLFKAHWELNSALQFDQESFARLHRVVLRFLVEKTALWAEYEDQLLMTVSETTKIPTVLNGEIESWVESRVTLEGLYNQKERYPILYGYLFKMDDVYIDDPGLADEILEQKRIEVCKRVIAELKTGQFSLFKEDRLKNGILAEFKKLYWHILLENKAEMKAKYPEPYNEFIKVLLGDLITSERGEVQELRKRLLLQVKDILMQEELQPQCSDIFPVEQIFKKFIEIRSAHSNHVLLKIALSEIEGLKKEIEKNTDLRLIIQKEVKLATEELNARITTLSADLEIVKTELRELSESEYRSERNSPSRNRYATFHYPAGDSPTRKQTESPRKKTRVDNEAPVVKEEQEQHLPHFPTFSSNSSIRP